MTSSNSKGESLKMGAIQNLARVMQLCLLQTQPGKFSISSKLLESNFVRLISDIESGLRNAQHLHTN